MKYYNASFFDSLQFYSDYFLPNISLKKYIWSQSQFGDDIKDIEAEIQRYYMTLCTKCFKENIICYSDLSSYILDENKNIKLLDEYIFMKLRYYATKFLDLINEAENFFEEEITRFRENNYNQSLLSLCTANFQHQQAKFYPKDSNLIIHFQENKKFQFYGLFFVSNISLGDYCIQDIYYGGRKGSRLEEIEKSIKEDCRDLCYHFFKENIYFYNELSKHILDENKNIKLLDEHIFFKIRYYATKFLLLVNEAENFFEEERLRLKNNHYPLAILELSKSSLRDSLAEFQYNGIDTLYIHFLHNKNESIYEFKGVRDWKIPEFFNNKPALMLEELYEKSENQFHYNTLWYYDEGTSYNCSELCLEFNELRKVK